MLLSWNVELALTGNVMASAAASSIMMGAAYTSCGCGSYLSRHTKLDHADMSCIKAA